MSRGKCKSCGADILWVTNRYSGKAMPLDVVPCDEGNVCLIAGNKAYVVLKEDRHLFGKLNLSHFASCPQGHGQPPYQLLGQGG